MPERRVAATVSAVELLPRFPSVQTGNGGAALAGTCRPIVLHPGGTGTIAHLRASRYTTGTRTAVAANHHQEHQNHRESAQDHHAHP